MKEMDKNKKCCLNCTYLRMERYSILLDGDSKQSLTWNNRKQISENRLCLPLNPMANPKIGCHHKQFNNIDILSDNNRAKIDKKSSNFISTNRCPFFYKHSDYLSGLFHDKIAKRQIMEIDLENAITAKKALEISRKGFWFTIVVLIISTIGAGLAILDFFGDKKWQDNQISALRETNTLLKQQIEQNLADKSNSANQATYGSSPWQEYIKSEIKLAAGSEENK